VYDYALFFSAFSAWLCAVRVCYAFASAASTNHLHAEARIMKLSSDDIMKIADLARLAITPGEVAVYAASLSKIINMVQQLAAADVAQLEPMAHPLASQVQRLRPDAIIDEDRREKYQANAARVAAGLYLVPKVIE
jgi:aspartyl-tRNA(Asn)/glutamyl-tRNA(Gln) amidotransferase subunit C